VLTDCDQLVRYVLHTNRLTNPFLIKINIDPFVHSEALPRNVQIAESTDDNSIENALPNTFRHKLPSAETRQLTSFIRNMIRPNRTPIPTNQTTSSRQEDPEVEQVTPSNEPERPSATPPNRHPVWTFIKSFLEGVRTGNGSSMIGQLVQQIQGLMQKVSNFFTGSNDVSFTMVEREAVAVHRHRGPSNAAEPRRSIRAKRLAPDDLLHLFQTNSSQVEQQLKQGVLEIERSLDGLWSQLQNTFSRANVSQVLKRFEMSDEQVEETKQIANEFQDRVASAWKQLSKEVSSRVDLLTEQVQTVASGLATAATAPNSNSTDSLSK
jgi:hypothetical protein